MEDKQSKVKKKKKKKQSKSTILLIVLIIVGLLIMLYPTISNWYNEVTGSFAIQEFNEHLADQDEVALAEQRMLAEAYNTALRENPNDVKCDYEYEDILNYGNGMMGYVEIPSIDVYLPVYHGVDESVLSKGVGHISKTAFPIGGVGNHSVLTGHTGLPSAKLFTDLIEVKEGEEFYVHILNEVVAYEVDQILTVLPEEVDSIQMVPGEDYCTLVTCTPYGINSHRLLVRGHRIEVAEEVEEVVVVQEESTDDSVIIWICAGVAAIIIIVLLLLYLLHKKRQK